MLARFARPVATPKTLSLVPFAYKTAPSIRKMSTAGSNTNSILELIKADHRGILRLHHQLTKEDVDTDMKQRVLNTLIREIAVHSALEEVVVYPKIETKQDRSIADQMRADHQKVKNNLYQVDQIGYVTDPKVMSLLETVMTDLKEHIQMEENEEMPRFESLLTPEEQKNICNMWHTMRPTVPTRPHPSAPDKPPMEVAASVIATPMDKMKDMVRNFVDVDKT